MFDAPVLVKEKSIGERPGSDGTERNNEPSVVVLVIGVWVGVTLVALALGDGLNRVRDESFRTMREGCFDGAREICDEAGESDTDDASSSSTPTTLTRSS